MTIKDLQEEIIDEFDFFDDWMERYEYLIELGKSLPLISAENKISENLIFGCQSNVWLHARKKETKIIFTADGDAILTKGIISLLIRVYSNQTPRTIIETNANFIDKIGLKEHLSPTRANGLVAMIKRIKYFALKFELENS
ncbi:MAG: SufE family protein [Flavobacteriaceae bacterium]|nr:SufE family protein [Flavobacteriaceae bacterium]